ncbi:hypothetical protein [Brassicibacter mesophilus]|uniref:hypothetical protein n=1 Tax=Brassicibacter mesophilus TaxID=745119 RepID=UPI003D1F5492
MKNFNRYLSVVLIILILSSQLLSYNAFAEATSNTIYIYTAEDLIKFSKKCTLDTYSQKKIVKLANDIDLSGKDFSPIPSFSGIFDGDHHTISGLKVYGAGSVQGLFRYLQEEGVIKNLHVEGIVKPSGSKSEVGGIVGTNKGLIFNCSFKGKVNGTTSIGSIVGYNDKTGIIKDCQSTGSIIGEHYTGGIVGLNLGYVAKCFNNSKVNTTDSAIPNNDIAFNNLKDLDMSQLNSTENINTQTDTGGIVGHNQGIIESSQNHGTIGYQHVGYNIGGIAGRQSGYILNCKNYGIVNGRKDVGGVVGQAEPFIRLLFSEDTLGQIDKELVVLHDLIEKAVNEGDQSSEVVHDRLESLNELTASASNEMQNLTDSTTDYVDTSTDTINTGINRMRNVMIQLEPVLDSFIKGSDKMKSGFDKLEKGFQKLSKSSASINNSIKDLDDAFEDLDKASKNANLAFNKISKAMKLIEKAAENSEEVDKALNELDSALLDLQLAMDAGIEALEKIAAALENVDDPANIDWDTISKELRDELQIMSKHINSAIPKIRHALPILVEELGKDQALIREAITEINDAINDLKVFSDYVSDTSEDIQSSIKDLDSASSAATAAMKDISKGMGYFSDALDAFSNGLSDVELILKELNGQKKLQLPNLSSYVTESSDSLFKEMNKISNELSLLNKDTKNASESFYNNSRAINKQFEVIVEIIREGLNSLSFEHKDLFEDISDQSLQEESTIENGLIRDCYNEGSIFGDVNVGGIAGSMSIEYDFDPEDDIVNKGNKSFNFKYQTRALLISSSNKGSIQAKKDYVGGIVGKMDVGLINKSENYGSIESLYGDYIGGIVGSSNSIIRKCYSLSEISGRNYVGGIAGFATDVFDSFALIQINKSNEFTGAIAGDIAGEFKNNYFVRGKWEGVDGISYGNKATPQSYDNFILHEGLPESFKSFQLTFVVDGDIIDIIPFQYGDSLDLGKLPDIPQKKGYYGSWPPYNYDKLFFSKKLEAIYMPLIQVLSSDNNKSHPKLLVEGSFKPSDTLDMNEINSSNLTINNISVIEEWSIQLNATLDKPLTFRYLRPESNKNVILYQKKDNEWKELKTTVDGKYLLFESDLTSFNLAVVEKTNSKIAYYILSLMIIAITILLISKKKNTTSKSLG